MIMSGVFRVNFLNVNFIIENRENNEDEEDECYERILSFLLRPFLHCDLCVTDDSGEC